MGSRLGASSVLGGFFVTLFTNSSYAHASDTVTAKLATPPDPACSWLELP